MSHELKRPAADELIYATGKRHDGKILVGGAWRLWHQEGFPLEMTHLLCAQNGWQVDWVEAFCDASESDNAPALMKAMEGFLPAEEVTAIKFLLNETIRQKFNFSEFLKHKRERGIRIAPNPTVEPRA